MAAGVTSFTINDNADFNSTLVWTDQQGNPIDLTGFTAKMEIASTAPPGTVYYTLSSTGTPNSDITMPTPTTGTIVLFIPASVTATLNFQNAVYDLLLTSSGGLVTRLLQGNIFLSVGVTNVP